MTIASLVMACAGCRRADERYSYQFFDVFDTWIEITAYADSMERFEEFARAYHARMVKLHRLFDIYNEYDGLNNAKTVNDAAGDSPVAVDPLMIELLERCSAFAPASDGAVNVALGPALRLWHDARESAWEDPSAASPPPREALEAVRKLCSIDDLIVDRDAGTVFLEKEGMTLDLGSAAKGFAVEVAARETDTQGISAFLVNAGGNVLAQGTPPNGWNVALLDPASAETGGDWLGILRFTDKSAVTSGDYQRYFEADGTRYGHIIDPQTLQPARLFASVTVVGPSSGRADLLSTALFILPLEQGQALAASMGYDAIWVDHAGEITMTNGAHAIFFAD